MRVAITSRACNLVFINRAAATNKLPSMNGGPNFLFSRIFWEHRLHDHSQQSQQARLSCQCDLPDIFWLKPLRLPSREPEPFRRTPCPDERDEVDDVCRIPGGREECLQKSCALMQSRKCQGEHHAGIEVSQCIIAIDGDPNL